MITEPIEKAVVQEVLPKGEAARLGKIIYERVRADYDTSENKGKALIIDVDTEVCEMVEMDKVAYRLHEMGQSTRRYLVRIGYPTFFSFRSPRKLRVRVTP